MKKITLLITLMISSLGFSQNLITNGDFETDLIGTGWSGNALNVVTEGGNNYSAATVAVAGDAYTVNLSYVFPITTIGTSYKLTFKAWSDTNRSIIAGIGLNQAPYDSATEIVNLTVAPQTIVLNLTANFASETSRIIFDMGAATGFVGIDDVVLEEVVPADNKVLIEDFETSANYSYAGFEGLGSASIVTDPASGGAKLNGLELVSSTAGNPWQGADLVLKTSKIKLTTDKTVKVDVYSTQAFTLLGKVTIGTGPDSAASASYTTPGAWQTISLTFTQSLDGTAVANGEYSKISFFPGWKTANGWETPSNFTINIDNVTGEKIVVEPPFVPAAATTPTTPNAEVLSIYGDTGGFTSNWVKAYSFGGYAEKPDLDSGSGVNEAIKMDFSAQGYGEGNEATTDVSAYNYLHFDYYVDSNVAAGISGDDVRFILIDENNENNYILKSTGSDGTLIRGSWQSVSVPLSVFTGKGFNTTKFRQFKLGSNSDLNTKIVFFDNIYFSVNDPNLGNTKFEKSNLKVYPNPATSNLTIEAKNAIERVSVHNVLGQEVLSRSPKTNNTTLDISNLQKGTYIVRTTSEGATETTKVIKK